MLTVNIASKHMTIEISKSQEAYVKYTLGRQIMIFAVLWMGTRDIVIALTLTAVFILLADYYLMKIVNFVFYQINIDNSTNYLIQMVMVK